MIKLIIEGHEFTCSATIKLDELTNASRVQLIRLLIEQHINECMRNCVITDPDVNINGIFII